MKILKGILWAFAAILAVASLQPARPATHHWLLHRAVHLACFGLLALIGQSAVRDRKWLPLVFTGCVGFGAALELLQSLIYTNLFEWNDLRDDAIGAAGGLLCALLIGRAVVAVVARQPAK
jgi:hypothetical protein